MSYRGYTIVLEKVNCSLWEIGTDGKAGHYLEECPTHKRHYPDGYLVIDPEGKRHTVSPNLEAACAFVDALLAYVRGPEH